MTARPILCLWRLAAVIALAIGITPSHAAAQTFYPDDPLLREPTPCPRPIQDGAISAHSSRPRRRHSGGRENGIPRRA